MIISKLAFSATSLLIALGVFVSGELSVSHLLHLDAPCFVGSNCSDLASQSDAYYMGVPVAVFGLAMYCTLWVIHVAGSTVASRLAQRVVTTVSAVGALASWVLISKAHSSGIFCAWCLTSALSISGILALSALSLRRPIVSQPKLGWTYAQITVACAAIVVLKPTVSVPDEKLVADKAVLAAMPLARLSPSGLQAYGGIKPDYVLVMFVDFACSGCRSSLLSVMKSIEQKHDVRLTVRYLSNIHEDSKNFAVLAEEAEAHGVYWKFIRALCGSEYMPLPEARAYLQTIKPTKDPAGKITVANRRSSSDRIALDRRLCDDLGIWQSPTTLLWHQGQFKVLSSVEVRQAVRDLP